MGNKQVKFPSEIDLVTAAQAEYDFLRIVDSHPVLYQDSVIRNAIYRYEVCWLPIIAANGDTFLPAPLDVEWIWHCHLLNPLQYRQDCSKIVNKVIDHKPYKLCEVNRALSERYWKDRYPQIPFNIDLTNASPPLIDPNYSQQSMYDIASAILRQRSFNYSSSLPHFRDQKFLNKAVGRYYIMLELKRQYPSTYIVPCYDNDLIWHAHQQHPLIYQQDTSSMLGKMLDHDDTTNDRSPGSQLDQGSNATRKLWKQKGYKFAVPGAMYRGEPPMPQVQPDPHRFISLASQNYYTFILTNIARNGMQALHLKEVLQQVKLMAPFAEFQESTPCQYFDNTLATQNGVNCFTWRVVHCKKPVISAIEILDLYGYVQATAHSIGGSTLPVNNQVSDKTRVPTHDAKTERSFLIRGKDGDHAILNAKWAGFVKGKRGVRGQLGHLMVTIFKLTETNPHWVSVHTPLHRPTNYQWQSGDCSGELNLEQSYIRLNQNTKHMPENLCIAATISLAFVLCQPRAPPPKQNEVIYAYPPPPVNRPRALNLDAMPFLVAGGLYAYTLPRWYHATCHGGYFYQIHPHYIRRRKRKDADDDDEDDYYGGCGGGGGDGFEVEHGFNGGDDGFDAGGADWGGAGDTGGCGGCGGCGGGCGGGGCGGGGE